MDGFERRKEQKKESIRRAATELFKTYGFKKVSIDDIARGAGVSQVTIYNHFGSKDELVRDVVKAQFLGVLEKAKEIIYGERPFLEKLETLIFTKSDVANQYQGELWQSTIQADPEMQEFIEFIWHGEAKKLTLALFEQGKKEGYVNTGLSDEAVLTFYDIFRKGISSNSDLIEHIGRNPKLAQDLISLLVYGLNG